MTNEQKELQIDKAKDAAISAVATLEQLEGLKAVYDWLKELTDEYEAEWTCDVCNEVSDLDGNGLCEGCQASAEEVGAE